MKMVFAHFLQHYDIKLADEAASRTFTWRSATVPFSHTVICIRPRMKI